MGKVARLKSASDEQTIHKKMSIQFVRSFGLKPIPINPKSKFPIAGFELASLETKDHGETIRRIEADPQIGIAAVFEGNVVDVDIDIDKSAEFSVFKDCIRTFCPPTNLSWGRESHPNSHFLHWLDKPFDPGPYISTMSMLKKRRYPIEIRGGELKKLKYTVLPGSIHETGELIKWNELGEFDPTVEQIKVSAAELIKQIRLASATTLLTECWVEGVRNELSLALAGMSYRIAAQSSGDFLITKEDMVRVLDAVMQYAGDDDATRRRNLVATWDKLSKDEGARVTGGTRFAELTSKEIRNDLYAYLCDDPSMLEKEDAASRWYVWEGRGMFVNTDMVERGNPDAIMTKEAASVSAGHKFVHDREGNPVPLVKWLSSSQMVQRITGMAFRPDTKERIVMDDEGLKINTWTGMAVAPAPEPTKEEDIKWFKEYVKEILAGNDEKRYEWLMAWIADIFQNPADKPGTCLVLTGRQGAGKTFLGAEIIRPLIGNRHYVAFNTLTGLVTKHNSLLDRKLLVQADEAAASQQRYAAAELKSMITERTMVIDPKGIKQYTTESNFRVLVTSNRKDPVQIDAAAGERRFTVLEVSPIRARDMKYWNKTYQLARSTSMQSKLMRWLLDYKYDQELIRRPLDTKEKIRAQLGQVEGAVDWIIDSMTNGYLLDPEYQEHWFEQFDVSKMTSEQQNYDRVVVESWPTHVTMKAMVRSLELYAKQNNIKLWDKGLESMVREVMPRTGEPARPKIKFNDRRSGKVVQMQPRLYPVPSVEAICEYLKDKYGSVVEERLVEAELMQTLGEGDLLKPKKNGKHTEETKQKEMY